MPWFLLLLRVEPIAKKWLLALKILDNLVAPYKSGILFSLPVEKCAILFAALLIDLKAI
jgi:hypothetical protein